MKSIVIALIALSSVAVSAECRIPNSNVSFQARCTIVQDAPGGRQSVSAYLNPHGGSNDIGTAKTSRMQVAIVKNGTEFQTIRYYIKGLGDNQATYREASTANFADVCDRTDIVYDEAFSHITANGNVSGRVTCVLEKDTYQD